MIQDKTGIIVNLSPCIPPGFFGGRGTSCSPLFTSSVISDDACQLASGRFHSLELRMSGLLSLEFFILIPSLCDSGCLFLCLPIPPPVVVWSLGVARIILYSFSICCVDWVSSTCLHFCHLPNILPESPMIDIIICVAVLH